MVLIKKIEKSELVIKADNELIDLLKANKEIRGTQTGLSVAELMKMTDYYRQKSLELQNELSNYREKEDKLNGQAEKLKNALAEVNAWGKLNLLPGEANIIFENTYNGKTFIDPNSTQDALNLTLGKDRGVVVKKEKITDYSNIKFSGSNKKQVFV